MGVDAKSSIRVKFFELLFGSEKGFICIAASDPVHPKLTFTQRFYEWPDEAIVAEEYILSVELSHNVYFCVNLLDKKERKKDNCLPTNLVWADLDAIDPDTLDKFPPPIVIRSSQGNWQAIWRMDTPVPPEQAQEYSRRMAYLIGADRSGWDLGQLLRVPFTFNFKYDPPPLIDLERALEITAKAVLFEALPESDTSTRYVNEPLPEIDLDINAVLYRYSDRTNAGFQSWFSREPESDWSGVLWRLIHECFRIGMSKEETFVVVSEARCNKYARDGRPQEHLWRDILKAWDSTNRTPATYHLIIPELVADEPTHTFVDDYRDWAEEATDAVSDFHNLCVLVGLSAIVSNSVRLDTSIGEMVPNLWGLLLGDSTLTRKTTAMRLVVQFLINMDKELIIASDGTNEGLLMGIAARPNKASIYYRDEVSGLFDSMARKDYMAGMQETLTALYDSPPIYTRKLAKSTIVIEHPAFVFLGGGVPSRVNATTEEMFVLSGFLPRFLVSFGEANTSRRKDMGPSSGEAVKMRPEIFNKLADLYETYGVEVQTKIGGVKMMMPQRHIAKLTPEAWKLYNEIEVALLTEADGSGILRDLALPTFDRFSKSILKIAVILGAVRQKPKSGILTIERIDVINAAHYAEPWGNNAVSMMLNAGKGRKEKHLEKIYMLIEANPGIWKGEIMRRLRLHTRETTETLETLEERGMIRKEKYGKGLAYWAVL